MDPDLREASYENQRHVPLRSPGLSCKREGGAIRHTAAKPEVHASPAKPDLSPPLQPLAPFLGKWHCDGKFTSGKAISASLSFEPILNRTFVLFKHDDEPPFAYHAWAEWGRDVAAHQIRFHNSGFDRQHAAVPLAWLGRSNAHLDRRHPGSLGSEVHLRGFGKLEVSRQLFL